MRIGREKSLGAMLIGARSSAVTASACQHDVVKKHVRTAAPGRIHRRNRSRRGITGDAAPRGGRVRAIKSIRALELMTKLRFDFICAKVVWLAVYVIMSMLLAHRARPMAVAMCDGR